MAKMVGRPKKTDDLDLVDLDECLRRAQEYLKKDKPPFTRRTLRNKICAGEFERYGTYHDPQVDWNEVRRSLHWRRSAS